MPLLQQALQVIGTINRFHVEDAIEFAGDLEDLHGLATQAYKLYKGMPGGTSYKEFLSYVRRHEQAKASNPHYGRLVTTGSRGSVTPQFFDMPRRRGYRRFKKKRSRKAGYYKRPNPRLGYMGLGTRSDLREMKYWGASERTYDFFASSSTNINWSHLNNGGNTTLSHGLTTGSTKTTRVGSRIFIHRITIPWQVQYQADDITAASEHQVTATFGLALVLNQSTAGVNSSPTEIFSNSSAAEYTPDAMRNPDYTHKYKILRRLKITVRCDNSGGAGTDFSAASKSGRILLQFPKPLMLHFTASPSAVGNMPDNSLSVFGCVNMACDIGNKIPKVAKIGIQPRIYFTD